ncbi:MAG: hypothetical protein COX77_01640, partial [Candidatus Komeilibacteria bacterium CG_4_10_14_0_2_um_filter_37_10]
ADAQNFTLTAASGAITSATTANIASNVVATKFIVTLSTNTPTAGVADTVTLRATNAGNITDVDYDPTGLTFTFVDSVAANLSTHTSPGSNSPTIPNSATVIAAFASGEASLATFTLVEAESLGTITVSDATLSGTSASVTVKHAAASTFTVTPSSTTPDTNTTLNAIVTAKDTYGNTADGANGATAFTGIVFLTTNATSPVWYNQVANITSGGTKTFSSAVKFQTVENNVTITAENNGATVTGTSATITVSSPSAPTVTAQTPVNGATSQAITVSPTVTFSEAMDATTVNTNTVQIRALTGDAIVNSVVTYNVSTFVATIDPVASLSNSTSYYVWISGAKNSAGTTVTAYTTGADQDFGTVALADGTLAVTGISSVETYAAVAGGWPDGDSATADGWSWTFSVTVPTTETSFAMRFANWTSGSNTIATANNIRFYSAQASANADADNTRLITVAATDSTAITLTSDLDATTAGRQIQVTVQAQVPTGSAAGSYSTSYGITSVAP